MTDPTDPGGVAPRSDRGSRASRVGDPGSPVAAPLTIVLALLAVVGGLLILRSVRDADSAAAPTGGGDPAVTTVPVADPNAPTAAPVPGTAAPAPTATRTGATVLVANASYVGGSAATMTTTLRGAGYTVGDPVDVDRDQITAAQATTVIYYQADAAGAQAVATQLQADLAAGAPQPLPTPIPTEDGTIGAAQVLVLLGTDKVGATIAGASQVALPNVPTAGTAAP